jgi:hypothetical protein
MVAHEALSRLAKARAAADAEEGRWLLAALRLAAHVHLGFGSFAEYIERSFGYKPRSTQEKLRVAEALEELPILANALAVGTIHWSAARELTRVATRETEAEWLEVALGKSVRQLEELVAGKRPGDDPNSANNAAARRHVLRFEVAAETFALFREAMTALRRNTDVALDDDSALLALARLALGGPRDEGRASYQIAVTVCAECGRGHQLAVGELLPVDADIVAMAHCDGQQLGRIAPLAANENATSRFEDVTVNEGMRVGTENRDDAQVLASSGSANGNDAHVGSNVCANDSLGAHAGARAKQTTPPALRRAVLLRDQRRCTVPGCRNAAFLDVHHLELRSEGGSNQADNLTTLCGAHHRAAHRGRLLIDGNQPDSLRFRHADGSQYGRTVQPQALEIRAKVFSALRNLGFREGEVRAALDSLSKQSARQVASFDQLLREALAEIHPSSPRR